MDVRKHSGWGVWDGGHSVGIGPCPGVRRQPTETRPISVEFAAEACRAEWHARPLGALGRRLLPEIESYLEFFAVAHASDGAPRRHGNGDPQ